MKDKVNVQKLNKRAGETYVLRCKSSNDVKVFTKFGTVQKYLDELDNTDKKELYEVARNKRGITVEIIDNNESIPVRQINITKLPMAININQDLSMNHGRLTAVWELWFDSNKYFGIKNIENNQKIKFYSFYQPNKQITSMYVISGPEVSIEREWGLTKSERKFLFKLMKSYCRRKYGMSLKRLCKECSRR